MADLTLDLYRACKRNKRKTLDIKQNFNSDHGTGFLYPDYTGFWRKDNTFRAPDVTTFTDDTGTEWIRGVNDTDPRTGRHYVSRNEGVSLSTTPGKFGYKFWFYFLLPEGTPVPDSLDVVQTGTDQSHYAIRCKNLMRKDAYEGALNNLARAAIAKATELKRASLYFS
ncbi:Tse2 family ADP-ribosyltransferase toxin [Methylocaldum szegediense]|uniref:ADPRTs_Tse2 domain-containing protein n=1 Tax=Methylocaldum szegediense TaxID=73780 RepID=A0ABM9I618_9GAMM|nr:hypothetical protein [Methylocaldum szegediense]CAI8914812.1 ADPRTs_Tse2 domain-containing protein [Methylocaldum szegediense]